MSARAVLDGIKARPIQALRTLDSTIASLGPLDGIADRSDLVFIRKGFEGEVAKVARLTAAVDAVLAIADRHAKAAECAEQIAVDAAEANQGAVLMAAQAEKYAWEQAERLIRAAIENALKESQ